MKFKCRKKDIEKAIGIVQKAVSSRSTMKVLEGLLIECGEVLKITGNDLELGIEYILEAQIEEKGSVVINSKMLGDIIKRLPDSEIRMESAENNIMKIECENSHFEIKSLSSDDFPEIPVIRKENAFSIKQGVLQEMIRQTIFSVSTDETRPILSGALLECSNGILTMVACDSYRVAVRKAKLEDEDFMLSIVVPGKTMGEVAKILMQDDSELTVYSTKNQIQFDMGRYKLVSRLLEGEYFKYRSFIPQEYRTSMTVDREGLLSAIERASLVIVNEERRYPVKFRIEGDMILIQTNTNMGSAREEVYTEIEGEDLDIRFNHRYFIEALRVIEEPKVELSFTNDMGPCVIKPVDGDDFIYLIVPLRKET